MTPFTDAGKAILKVPAMIKLGESDAEDVLRAALPHLERHFREKFAKELEADGQLRPPGSHVWFGRMDAAAFLRGSR